MRNAPLKLLSLLALALAWACAPGAEEEPSFQESPCLKGFALLNEVSNELQRVPLSCTTAADCTMLPLHAECAGSQVSSCGIAVHRDVLPHHDQANVDARFCAFVQGSEYGCSAGPSCVQSEIACEAGRCVTRTESLAPTSP